MKDGATRERRIDLVVALVELAALVFITIVAADRDAAKQWISRLSQTTLHNIEIYALWGASVSAILALILLLRRKTR